MTPRLDPFASAPEAMTRWLDFGMSLQGLEPPLRELVKIRASQINRCANCLHMHTRDARKAGETEERLYLLNAWRECALYSPRERAALAWTETLTRLADQGAPDAAYDELNAHFGPDEQVELTLLINAINGWNRIAVGFGLTPPVSAAKAAA